MKNLKRTIFLVLLLAISAGILVWSLRKPAQVTALAPVHQVVPSAIISRPVYKEAVVPKRLKKRTAVDSGFALGFANFLCGVNYRNYVATTEAFHNLVTPELGKVFFQDFFSKAEIQDILDRRLVLSFKLSKPILVLKAGDTLDEFLVEGILTTKSEADGAGKKVENQPVAMIIGFAHGPKTEGQISVFEKAVPSDETNSMAQSLTRVVKGI